MDERQWQSGIYVAYQLVVNHLVDLDIEGPFDTESYTRK